MLSVSANAFKLEANIQKSSAGGKHSNWSSYIGIDENQECSSRYAWKKNQDNFTNCDVYIVE